MSIFEKLVQKVFNRSQISHGDAEKRKLTARF